MDDYSTLPCDDAEEVDQYVYESPLDDGGYANEPKPYYNKPDDEVCVCVYLCTCVSTVFAILVSGMSVSPSAWLWDSEF